MSRDNAVTAQRVLERVMLAFVGEHVPRWVERRLSAAPAAGVTLFRAYNVRSPGQVRELTDGLQRAAGAFAGGVSGGESGGARSGGARSGGAAFSDRGGPSLPLIVAADQECGQLQALGSGATQFAGNMALGAADDVTLTEEVARAIGREARAMGVNVVYSPVLDLAVEPANASLGIRSFGEDPALVARHGAAMVRGLQSAGVAATAKHFPGLGAAAEDTHHLLGVIPGTREHLDEHELPPFRAAIKAGVMLAMSAHVAVPGLSGDPTLPGTLSRAVIGRTLRDDLGFGGVAITDALDMRALAQGAAQSVEVIAAVRAGIDLLLCNADRRAERRIEETLLAAEARGLFEVDEFEASNARVRAVRSWLASQEAPPDVDIVGCAEHRALSRRLAELSLTRLDRTDGTVPGVVRGASQEPAHNDILLARDARILAIMPQPRDLTPADTSSYETAGLAAALRTRFDSVEEVVVPMLPSDTDIATLRERATAFDAVVIGTIEAHRHPPQAELVRAIAAAVAGTPTRTIAVALRTPWDAAVYPEGIPAICTYSILADPLDALARALAGEIGLAGRVPVQIARA